MTGPEDTTTPESQDTRPISVKELLARHGTLGAPPVGGRRRRRRGDTDSITVAELTGEIPVIGAHDDEHAEADAPAPTAPATNGTVRTATDAARSESGVSAEEMLPDPGYADPVDADPKYGDPGYAEADAADEDAELAVQERDLDEYADPHLDEWTEPHRDESADRPSYLHAVREPLFGGRFEDDLRLEEPYPFDEDEGQVRPAATKAANLKEQDESKPPQTMQQIGRGALIVGQSMLAVAFGAGLFIGFDQLWKWNNIVALVLSVLVILGLVIGVRIVRKTEDITSTLIAVAVGALVTLGPLALLQSG